MKKSVFRIVKDRPPPIVFAQPAVAALAQLPINKVAPAPTSTLHGRRLDVDAVLARSLPKVVSEQLPILVRSKRKAA
jgi:hypothetical protein